jgi:hypothetical protein
LNRIQNEDFDMKMELDHRFVASFKTFMDKLNDIVREGTSDPNAHMHPSGSTYQWTATYEEGYKYVRVVLVSECNGEKKKTAWGFIDKRSGDIFRSASWKAPSLNHIRGNLYDEHNGLLNAAWTGPAYIWEINDKKEDEAAGQPAPAGGI